MLFATTLYNNLKRRHFFTIRYANQLNVFWNKKNSNFIHQYDINSIAKVIFIIHKNYFYKIFMDNKNYFMDKN